MLPVEQALQDLLVHRDLRVDRVQLVRPVLKVRTVQVVPAAQERTSLMVHQAALIQVCLLAVIQEAVARLEIQEAQAATAVQVATATQVVLAEQVVQVVMDLQAVQAETELPAEMAASLFRQTLLQD